MEKEKIATFAIKALKSEYKNAKCSLNYKTPIELLIAAILSARCKDLRVNVVTKSLFSKFHNLDSYTEAGVSSVERIIKTCGLYKNKAKNIVLTCKILKESFGGVLPNNIKDLTSLPGVGRKTANLIMGEVFKKEAYIVDTHCLRITRRLGLHSSENPIKVEKILRQLVPKNESRIFCHRLVHHGKTICKKNPICDNCVMKSFCKFKNF